MFGDGPAAEVHEFRAHFVRALVARQGVLEPVIGRCEVIETEAAIGAGKRGTSGYGVVGLDCDTRERRLGEGVADGAYDGPVLCESRGGQRKNQSAREMISRNSSSVRTIGFAFMLLACAAFSTRIGRSLAATP